MSNVISEIRPMGQGDKKFILLKFENMDSLFSVWDVKQTENLTVGDEVNFEYKTTTSNGKEYKNITTISHIDQKLDIVEEDIDMTKEEKKPESKKSVSDYIVNIKGKEFITATGILYEAEKAGGIDTINTTLVECDFENSNAVVLATIKMKDGRIFENFGSATPKNLGAMVKDNFIEMATTRAISRALRFGLNVEACSVEELKQE